jgi:3-oxoadipate enol-lactonase
VTEKPQAFALDTPSGVRLAGERAGTGVPVVLLHGLTATRRYVLMGSRYLARAGCDLVAFDARGHGESSPAPDPSAYEYSDMVGDLDTVVRTTGSPVVLVGNSMGAGTAVAFALAYPERVSALAIVTPGFGGGERGEADLEEWDRLAAGMKRAGVEGFMDAYEPPADPRWRETALKFTRQRVERHRHPEAVADALRVVPRSIAFDGMDELERLDIPALVVGSRDESDPGHPLALAHEYADRLPRAELLVEDQGQSPIAWQGAQLSHAIEDFLKRENLLGQA